MGLLEIHRKKNGKWKGCKNGQKFKKINEKLILQHGSTLGNHVISGILDHHPSTQTSKKYASFPVWFIHW